MSRFKPYLQLVRLPNLFTAAADSLAGFLLAGGRLDEPRGWMPMCGASMAIYAGGIALNDAFDYEIDKSERPNRPLPSGRVSRAFAIGFGVVALLVGIGMAMLASQASAVVAAALVGCVLLYDAGLKRTPLGPEVMGACRGLNLLLGLSIAADFGGPAAWLAAGALAMFVAGLTIISRSEVEAAGSSGVVAGMVIQDVALLMLLGVALRSDAFPRVDPTRPILPPEGLLVLALVFLVVNRADAFAVFRPSPATIQAAVKTGVLSLVWIDVGLVASVRGVGPALAVAALWVPAFVLGKWLYST